MEAQGRFPRRRGDAFKLSSLSRPPPTHVLDTFRNMSRDARAALQSQPAADIVLRDAEPLMRNPARV
jgi:hypothetical protein